MYAPVLAYEYKESGEYRVWGLELLHLKSFCCNRFDLACEREGLGIYSLGGSRGVRV